MNRTILYQAALIVIPMFLTSGCGSGSNYESSTGEISVKDIEVDDPRLALLIKDALAGEPDAQCALGEFYREGLAVTLDYCKARQLFEKAASQNANVALHNLAYMAGLGECGPRDPDAACNFLFKAAALGNPEADKALKYSAMSQVSCRSQFLCIGLSGKARANCVGGVLDSGFECRTLAGSAKEACISELEYIWGSVEQ